MSVVRTDGSSRELAVREFLGLNIYSRMFQESTGEGILLPNFRDPGGSFRECAGVSGTGILGIFPVFSAFFWGFSALFPGFFWVLSEFFIYPVNSRKLPSILGKILENYWNLP